MSSSRYRNRPATLAACSSKRRRRTAATAAAATWDSSWASLHEDLVDLIGWRVLASDLRDYIRFRAVCPHWRSSTACPRGRGIVDRRFHPRRWMLLPEGHGIYPGHDKLRGFVRFFNLSTGAFVRVQVPLFRDHCVLDSVEGLLLQRDHDTAVRLLHPFTGDILDFPPLETLLRYVEPWLISDKWSYLRSITATCINVSANGVVSLMIMQRCMMRVVFANTGEHQWRVSTWQFSQFQSPLPFQGNLYVVHNFASYGEQEILQIDPPQMEGADPFLPPPRLIAKCPASTFDVSFMYHLVECGSEILVVAQIINSEYVGSHFSVRRLADLILGRTVWVTCICGNTLFLGGRNLRVSSKVFPSIEGDTIVFVDCAKRSLAQFHISSGTLSPASDSDRSVTGNVPSPCSISYHILTCCFRQYWNKGHIMLQRMLRKWRVRGKWRIGA